MALEDLQEVWGQRCRPQGMLKARAAQVPGEWARSRDRSTAKVGANENPSRNQPSRVLLVLRFLLFTLLFFFVARHRVLGLYDLADLVHVWQRLSAIPNHRRALAKHLQALRQWTLFAPVAPTAHSAHSLAVRADVGRYSNPPFGSGAHAAVFTGGIVKLEAM